MRNLFMAGLSLAVLFSSCVQRPGRVEGLKDGKEGQFTGLVTRKDYDVSKDCYPHQIMGKDFWNLRQVHFYAGGFNHREHE
jgi:hypothetical protein